MEWTIGADNRARPANRPTGAKPRSRGAAPLSPADALAAWDRASLELIRRAGLARASRGEQRREHLAAVRDLAKECLAALDDVEGRPDPG